MIEWAELLRQIQLRQKRILEDAYIEELIRAVKPAGWDGSRGDEDSPVVE